MNRRNTKRIKSTLKKLREKLEEHQQDLVIADTSPNGWLTVAKLRNRMLLPRDLRKKLEYMDKEILHSRTYGGGQMKLGKFQGQGGGGDIRTGRLQQRSHSTMHCARSGQAPVHTTRKKTTSNASIWFSGGQCRISEERG